MLHAWSLKYPHHVRAFQAHFHFAIVQERPDDALRLMVDTLDG